MQTCIFVLKTTERYIIPLTDSKEEYICEFNITKNLFHSFGNLDISGSNLVLQVRVNKHSSYTEFMLNMSGFLEIKCDRCLDKYNQDLDIEELFILKPGAFFDDQTDDKVITYPRDFQSIDITQYVYEYIILGLPLKRMHQNPELCNQEMIEKIESFKYSNDHYDQRWNELNKISYGTS